MRKVESVVYRTMKYLKIFLFFCRSCGLMNILDFDKICNKETVLYLKKREKLNKRIEETINNLIQIKIEKLIITTC